MTTRWSEVFRRSRMDPDIFGVAPGHRAAVRTWLDEQDVPCVVARDLYSPTVRGWAVLDGGCTEIHRYGLTSLPSGIRVVGRQTLRLLIADLGLAGTVRPSAGERFVELPELRRRHAGASARDADAERRADRLASCQDGESIRAVAHELLGRQPTGTPDGGAPDPAARPHGPMGPWRSERWVAEQLAARRQQGS